MGGNRIGILSAFLFVVLTSRPGYAEDQFREFDPASGAAGFGAPQSEYQIGVIERMESDGTLTLTNGTKIKVSESDAHHSSLHPGREILVFVKNGIRRFDREGRMMGVLIMAPAESIVSDAREAGSLRTQPLAGAEERNLAAQMAVAPPVGRYLAKENTRQAQVFYLGADQKEEFFIDSEGQVSGSVIIS